ncbi:hypothetical protein McpSp1_06790 [Methanocorpusculaceae archaeon Sp1]|nr:hypothetical protein [Methanocorpusculaceae archaeon Sp1]
MTQSYVSIKKDVLALLERELAHMQEHFGVRTIGLFGSVSRGEDTPESDVDIVVGFREGEYTLANLVYLADYLEEKTKRSVDVVPDDAISRYLRPFIEDEVIMIAPA